MSILASFTMSFGFRDCLDKVQRLLLFLDMSWAFEFLEPWPDYCYYDFCGFVDLFAIAYLKILYSVMKVLISDKYCIFLPSVGFKTKYCFFSFYWMFPCWSKKLLFTVIPVVFCVLQHLHTEDQLQMHVFLFNSVIISWENKRQATETHSAKHEFCLQNAQSTGLSRSINSIFQRTDTNINMIWYGLQPAVMTKLFFVILPSCLQWILRYHLEIGMCCSHDVCVIIFMSDSE
jgi:hypothetical protein